MPAPNFFLVFTRPLHEAGLRYMVTGAVASIIYGEPRMTLDLDLVLELTPETADKIHELFPLEEFYRPPLEVIRLEAGRPQRGHFNLIHHESGLKADVYLSGRDEMHRWGLTRRAKVELQGGSLWVAPVEYVILRKLEYYREGASQKHLLDIAGMRELSADKIDFQELEQKILERGLKREWDLTRGRDPEDPKARG